MLTFCYCIRREMSIF